MISVAILHAQWRPERVRCLNEMLVSLGGEWEPAGLFAGQKPARMAWSQFKTILALSQWEWSLAQSDATHHLFLTDDLHMAPGFNEILAAMVTANPRRMIGLLSNHPSAEKLARLGERSYRCNSWLVGPAYCVPRAMLQGFVDWYKSLPDDEEPGGRRWFNDDSALNEWNTRIGPGESWHPLPTIIEHRADLESCVGHGDKYSRERVSWRYTRECIVEADRVHWRSEPATFDLEAMKSPEYWGGDGPMLTVGGES